MDVLNDYYPLYPPNPNDDSDLSEEYSYIEKFDYINENRKRKKNLSFDDFCMKYSDDLWYIWCVIIEYRGDNSSVLFNRIDYPNFCSLCYENSTKY